MTKSRKDQDRKKKQKNQKIRKSHKKFFLEKNDGVSARVYRMAAVKCCIKT